MNTDYTVSLRLTNEYDEIWHASYPTSGFFCDNDPIPYKALQTVTLTPAARTFLETGMVCTYMKNYPVSYDVLWGLHFTSQKDPQKTLILHLKPLEITDKGQLVFKLTDKLACDFAPGEALTLSVRAVDPHCGMTYQSEPTEGYCFDLFGTEPPVQQGGEIVTPILPPKPSETKRSVSPLWFLAPICLVALATAAIFTLKGRKK